MLIQYGLGRGLPVAPVEGPVTPDLHRSATTPGTGASTSGSPVRSHRSGLPVSGRVTFAGSVAGMISVTIEPVPGFKVSVSYLSEVSVSCRSARDAGRDHRRHPGAHMGRRASICRSGSGVATSTPVAGWAASPRTSAGPSGW